MELPERKQIRLKDYDYSLSNMYFVTICTYNRTELFGGNVGAHLCVRPDSPNKIIIKWLFEIENKYKDVKIDKYVIMPDHIHFIIYLAGAHVGAPLPEIIKWFKTQTTNEYINVVKNGLLKPFNKHIWQRGYYEHIIRNDEDYKNVWQYIENNPLKIGECKKT